jgi:YidC/Oxa1 family membrane protein insertase
VHDAAASTPVETVGSAASRAEDIASTLASQASSSIQDVAHEVASTVEHAIEPSTADLPPPTTLFDNITQVGQLKELGLDYGWGPTATVEWITEHIHVFAGTPWWGTIITSAIAMRIFMVYPFFRMSKEQAKFTAIGPDLKILTDERQKAEAAKDNMGMQVAMKKMSILKNRAGISMSWMFAPIVVQAVFGFGAFKLTRAMAALPVPGFETGGFAWMTDLTVCDPTYITPVAMWLAMHLLGRVSAFASLL